MIGDFQNSLQPMNGVNMICETERVILRDELLNYQAEPISFLNIIWCCSFANAMSYGDFHLLGFTTKLLFLRRKPTRCTLVTDSGSQV